ncbi:carbohydrate ABC transporter permease [Mycoplasma phocimorsus]|uniref:Sugar ABC transporter permease n=1 Tax=Mycoplasma phocimorsus TaxID=3045839 RepID=A0AAJ1PUB4_9MOLU|nr:sugar ABC transporter permease [Mycoplasma phocimorsus]MDJ1645966.1 sugar ABC transporter permease [Mycoplasma phocimorsus]MDJ1646252.1 sugar ABC transporter permease [Mycoplasma phocimorsus]MDJ1646854.1 sugar ABC transporter permease [Mycoplasma phocimorsus]MDJ1647823.1 sugar ABC transporter permease [Mycoplasma phocimorsus]MDJ1648478.1 sugar ABC transporter permease [Mycoplasma phocimorsus]
MKITENNIISKSPLLYKFGVKQNAKKKWDSLAGSVVDKKTPAYQPLLFLLPALIVLTIFTIIPFIFSIFSSIFVIRDGKSVLSLETYSAVFNDPAFAVGFRNSLMFGIIVLPLKMGISLLISSCIATLVRAKAKGFWQTVFFLPYVTNIVAVSLTFVQFFSPNGLFNKIFGLGEVNYLSNTGIEAQSSFLPLVVVLVQGVWSGLAFNVLIFTTAMLVVDKNLYRSASVDGVNGVKQFFSITLPSIKSTTTFLVTLSIIGGIKIFPLALFENNTENAIQSGGSTIMLYVYKQTNSGDLPKASASAISLFLIGVIYSVVVRGGFKAISRASANVGEYNVWNKIKKTTKEI